MKINFNETQKQGIKTKLKTFDKYDITDDRWRAYMLATSYHETAGTMQPVEEFGKGAGRPYGQKRKYNRTIYVEPNRLFFGRGDVQLTWYENYEMMGKLLNLPLLNQPELALDPDISARIMIEGMTRGKSNRGDFTGVSLENYFNAHKEDPFNARRIINGLDCAKLIEGYYWKFLSALRNSQLLLFFIIANTLLLLVGCKPKQVVYERDVTVTDSTAVWELKDSLQIKEREISVLRSELNRFIEDNLNLGSEMLKREIYYDTNAPIDSMSMKHPILREIFTTNNVRLEKSVRDYEVLIREDSFEKVGLTSQNSNLELKVEKLIDEDKSVKNKSVFTSSWMYVLIGVGVILVVLFVAFR